MNFKPGDHVRVQFPHPYPGWMSGEVIQVNNRKRHTIIRFDADKSTALVPYERLTKLRERA